MTLDSDKTWKPNGFNVVSIDGAGSTIEIKNKGSANKKFADWSKDSLLIVSNLTIKGFNHAFVNNGGQLYLNNVCLGGNIIEPPLLNYIWECWFGNQYNSEMCGGGIVNENGGHVYCKDCTFLGNYAYAGGAICNSANLELWNCIFSGNNAIEEGEDIENFENGKMTIDGITYLWDTYNQLNKYENALKIDYLNRKIVIIG